MVTQMTSLADQLPSISTVDNGITVSGVLADALKFSSYRNECPKRRRRRDQKERRGKVCGVRHRQTSSANDIANWEDDALGMHYDFCCCFLWKRGRGRSHRWERTKTTPAAGKNPSTFFTNGFSTATTTIFAIIIVILQRVDTVEAVRCYCTDEHCVPYGVCEAAVCLVGLLRANNAVIRTCGNEAIGCQRNLDRWSHICSCEEHFCNTFLFLRASTNIENSGNGGGGNGRTVAEQYQHQQQMGPAAEEDDRRVFERMDPPPGEFATFDHPTDEEDERTLKKSNLLTLLLVIVPLSVGAAAVVVVAINYYCHLC